MREIRGINQEELQGVLFNWSPLKFSKYKIPVYLLTLGEILEQLTWDLELRKFRGAPVKKDTL